jgi:ABC-type Co2+ transport system permease subunit
MTKCLTVVALVLLVLTGALGLRNLTAANAATFSASGVSAHAIWASGPGPIPSPPGGGGHVLGSGPGPIPSPPGGGGH